MYAAPSSMPPVQAAPITYKLNEGQQAAAEAFFEFLFAPERDFIISGPAGVGKTFWMGYIIDIIMPRYLEACKMLGMAVEYNGVVMTATTNKAAQILQNATGRPTQTIHSFLRLTVKEDFSTGKTVLKRSRDHKIHQGLILFVDECSMVDSDLWHEIQDSTLGCKLVWVGDHNQLAPVLEKISPIYNQRSPFFELTQQMRTSVPELQAINQQLRDTVATNQFQPIQIVPGVIDHVDDQTMADLIEVNFAKQTHEARILAYTNKRVIQYNDHIRELRGLPKRFVEGEFLVNNSAFTQGQNMLSVETEVTVLKNHGDTQLEIARDVDGDPVMLDVNYLDIRTELGGIMTNVAYPTNRTHYNALIKYYVGLKNWERVSYLKNMFVDLRPRDASTVHKAQGSTYDYVFIDLGNISTCHNPNQVARMLYVAFSRARKRVFLYGELAAKYGGLIRP